MTRDQVDMMERVLLKEAVASSAAIGLFCRTESRDQIPQDILFAQFWYRLGRTQSQKAGNGEFERTVGWIQYTIVEPDGFDRALTTATAYALAKSFTLQRWLVSPDSHVATHKMNVAILPRSNVIIVDGGFDFVHFEPSELQQTFSARAYH